MASGCIRRYMGYIGPAAIIGKDSLSLMQRRSPIGQFRYGQGPAAMYITGCPPDTAGKGGRTGKTCRQHIGKSRKIRARYIYVQIEYRRIPIDADFS